MFDGDNVFDKGNINEEKIAFICVHNSCRSQMAEAIGNKLYVDNTAMRY